MLPSFESLIKLIHLLGCYHRVLKIRPDVDAHLVDVVVGLDVDRDLGLTAIHAVGLDKDGPKE